MTKWKGSLNSDMQRRGAAEVTLGYEAYGLWTEVLDQLTSLSVGPNTHAILGYAAAPTPFRHTSHGTWLLSEDTTPFEP